MSDLAPIALFVYNRPDHTRQTLTALVANTLASQSDLFIYSDGARSVEQASAVDAVRAVIRDVAGFKSVTVIERERNYGLAASIIDGVTSLCDRYGRIIVLEDDLLTAPGFLSFMNRALDHYVDDESVMQVAGHSFLDRDDTRDCFMLPMTTSWGWATWKRAWDCFDAEAKKSDAVLQDNRLRYKFDLDGAYYFSKILSTQVAGNIDSWAIRWYLSVFVHDGIVLYPPVSIVRNIGFDGSGTHCGTLGDGSGTGELPSGDFDQFPALVIDQDALREAREGLQQYTGVKQRPAPGPLHYVREAVRRLVRKFSSR